MTELIKKIDKLARAAKKVQKNDCATACSPEARRLKDIINKMEQLESAVKRLEATELPLNEYSKNILEYCIAELAKLKKEILSLPKKLISQASA